MEYQIIDTDTFNKASARVKRSVERIIEDMKTKGLDITPTGGGRNKGLSVDIIKMFKEGSIFKKYIYTGDMPIIATILGVKHYYLEMRVSILNLNLKAVNLYYSHAIGFFDIQNLVRFPKDKQEVVLSDILHNTTIKTRREERVTLYNKYNIRHFRKLNVDKWKRTRGRPKKNIEPPSIGNILNKINLVKPVVEEEKFNGWCSFKGCEFPFGAMHSHLHPTTVITEEEKPMELLWQKKQTIDSIPNLNSNMHPVFSEKEKDEYFGLREKLDEKDVIINPNKLEEKTEFTTAEKLLKEKEYYDNLEMVIPANAVIEEVD